MKNVYKITKGQLISIWIFGVIGSFVSIGEAEYSGFATFISVLIPALLIFYTIGWCSFNKIKREDVKQGFRFKVLSVLPSKKKLIFSVIFILLIILIVSSVLYIMNIRKDNLKKEQLRQEYNEAIQKVDILKEQVKNCLKPVLEKKYAEEVRNCNLLKNKIKHDYDFCVSLESINSPASCLYDNDYEKIDCSQETLEKTSRSKITKSDIPKLCLDAVDDLIKVNYTIESYSKWQDPQ